jgi:hypothetical protein
MDGMKHNRYNLAAFIQYLGHSIFSIKSIVTGQKANTKEAYFQVIKIDKAEDHIKLRNGKRQLYTNLQELKETPEGYHSFRDIKSYKNIYLDIDAEKPDGMKDYAATEEEQAKAISQLSELKEWLASKGFLCGLELSTGNGAGIVLPIPVTKAEPVFIAKLATFLKRVPGVDTSTFDPGRIIGIPGTINAKLETEDRKNRVREVVGEIPERIEDQALLDYINSLEPDPSALKEWSKKYGEQQAQPEPDTTTTNADDIIDRITGILGADQKLKGLLGGDIEAYGKDRSRAEYGACGKLIKYGFTDSEINWIMCHVSKIGKWQEEGDHYRFEQTLRKLREAEDPKAEEPKPGTPPTKDNDGPKPRACIKLCGDLIKNEDEVLTALYAYNNPPTIYQRGGSLCRIKQISEDRFKIEDLTDYALRNDISRAATFQRYKPKKEKEGEEKKTTWQVVPCEPPINLVRGIMALDAWDIPYINGLISAPVIRADGSLLLEPGYDKSTGLSYMPNPKLVLPDIPKNPTKDDAIKAASFLMDEVLYDFPFVDNASKAGALAAFLTPIIRPMIKGCVPMALIDKPAPGTGASLLLDLISIVATGNPMAALSAPGNEEEWRKLITSILRDGASMSSLDNIASDLKSDSLSRALTSTTWKDRTLGKTDAVEYPQRSSWYGNGNNLALGGDLPRRCHLIQLDAGVTNPWERTGFRHTAIKAWVDENRGQILAALLTMVRAWVVSGRPNGCKHIIGGFDEWVTITGGVLSYAGISDFLGNLSKLYEEVDVGNDEWAEFFKAWHEAYTDKGFTSSEVLSNLRNPHIAMGQCTPTEITEKIKFPGPGDAKKVSHSLRKKLNVRYKNGLMLTYEGDTHDKMKRWKVVIAKDHAISR